MGNFIEEYNDLVGRISAIYDVVSALGATDPMPATRDTWHLSSYIQSLPIQPVVQYTARDYPQTGLVGIWDGIENSDWGAHAAGATGWRDLVSRNITEFNGSANIVVYDNNVYLNAQALQLSSYDFSTLTARTIEIVFADDSGNQNNRVYLEDNLNNNGFSLQSNTAGRRVSTNLQGAHQGELAGAYGIPISLHWAMTQDSSGTKIWLNGQLKATSALGFTQFRSIGLGLRAPAFQKVYCVRVYDRVLTNDELQFTDVVDRSRFNY